MRRLSVLLLAGFCLLLAALACRGEERIGYATLYCAPCDGQGGMMKLSTRLPVPVAVVMAHKLCFSNDGKDRCWYGCPGTIEESFSRGLELCGGGAHGN